MTVVDTKSMKLDYFLIFTPTMQCTCIEPFSHGGWVVLWATWPADVHLDISGQICQGAPNRYIEQLNIKTVFNSTIWLWENIFPVYTIMAPSGSTSGVNKRDMAESIRTHVGKSQVCVLHILRDFLIHVFAMFVTFITQKWVIRKL